MTDGRPKCEDTARVAAPGQVGNYRYEIDIRLSTYFSLDMKEIAPRIITFEIAAMDFRGAVAQANLLAEAYRQMRDIHCCDVLRVERTGG